MEDPSTCYTQQPLRNRLRSTRVMRAKGGERRPSKEVPHCPPSAPLQPTSPDLAQAGALRLSSRQEETSTSGREADQHRIGGTWSMTAWIRALVWGHAAEARQDAKRAVQCYAKLVSQSPDDVQLLLLLARAQGAAGNSQAAIGRGPPP